MGHQYLLSELAEMVCMINGKRLPIVILDGTQGLDYSGSNQRLKDDIKDLEITSMQDALSHLYDFYYKNKNIIDLGVLRESR